MTRRIRRRTALAAPLALAGPLALPWGAALAQGASAPAAGGAARKVLRYAFLVAETGFDPARVSDLYSRICIAHMHEGLFRFDYLARPARVVPHIAEGMPEVADDFRTWTFRIRRGVYFHDDPAFKGQPRELTAEDYVYSFKRFFDPKLNSPLLSGMQEQGFLGLDELRKEALDTRRPFDYARPVDGVQALDRYTLRLKVAKPRPRLLYSLADSSVLGAVAREVIEFYGDRSSEHPVGTGPFRLAQWRRSSFLAFERHPNYRDVRYDGEPAADDAVGQKLLATFRGRKLPMVDRIEVSIIEESQPRWLSFLNREIDVLMSVPLEFAAQAVPNGELAPYLAKAGVQMDRFVNADRTLYYFNMEDPVVGGYAAPQVALRRAISLATDIDAEIRQVRRSQAIPAQTSVSPGGYGYDPTLRTENGIYSPARAKALLDVYGYVDRDGDGWRELPDGKPLVIEYATTPDSISRQFDELWKKNMDAIGVRIKFRTAKWPEQLKAARAGQLQIWQLGYSNSNPDFQDGLQTLYGPASGGQNLGRFKLARFDQLYDRMQAMPDSPERLALLREAQDLVTAYAPMKYNVHRIITWLAQARVRGLRAPTYGNQFWQYVDIDDGATSAGHAGTTKT